MQLEEQRLINRLFKNLKQVEQNTKLRDFEVEHYINNYIRQQPTATYYMVQLLLIQEVTLNHLNQQIQYSQDQFTQLKASQQQKGNSFFSKLFSIIRSPFLQYSQLNVLPTDTINSTWYITTLRGGSFMFSALQTAVSIAGGMVLGDILTKLLHHSSLEEIFNSSDNNMTIFPEINNSLLTKNFDATKMEIFNHINNQQIFDQDNLFINNELSNNIINDDEFI